jgi:hypothetical protein
MRANQKKSSWMRAMLDMNEVAKSLGTLAAFLICVYGLDLGFRMYQSLQLRTQRKSDMNGRRNDASKNVKTMRERCTSTGDKLASKLLGEGIAVTSTSKLRSITPAESGTPGAPTRQIVDALRCGDISAAGLLKAMQARSVRCAENTNCVVEFFDSAEPDAQRIDKDRGPSSSSGTRSVLNGCPVSIKECFGVKGYHSTIGLGKLCANDGVALEDSVLVQAVKAAGGVPFCHTNIPQVGLNQLTLSGLWMNPTISSDYDFVRMFQSYIWNYDQPMERK